MRLLAVAAVALAAAGTAGAQAPRSIAAQPSLERQVIAGINAVRVQHHLVPLRANGALASVARAHSRELAQTGTFTHDSADGSPFGARVRKAYPPAGGSWGIAENIVWAAPSLPASKAVALWMASPPHRKNILTAAFREIGVGGVHAVKAGGVYAGQDPTIVTADFGVR